MVQPFCTILIQWCQNLWRPVGGSESRVGCRGGGVSVEESLAPANVVLITGCMKIKAMKKTTLIRLKCFLAAPDVFWVVTVLGVFPASSFSNVTEPVVCWLRKANTCVTFVYLRGNPAFQCIFNNRMAVFLVKICRLKRHCPVDSKDILICVNIDYREPSFNKSQEVSKDWPD